LLISPQASFSLIESLLRLSLAVAAGSEGTTITITVTVPGAAVNFDAVKTSVSTALARNGNPLDPARIVVHAPMSAVGSSSATLVIEVLPASGECAPVIRV
jgi:hypothetical protein